jgi:hypothetical protein
MASASEKISSQKSVSTTHAILAEDFGPHPEERTPGSGFDELAILI